MADAFTAKRNKRADAGALLGAAEDGDAAAVARLLAAGAGADARLAPVGETPLMRAAARGHEEAARVLLDAGADPSARRADGFTPLILAVFFGHEGVARLLVERGADVRARTGLGTTAASWAASRGFAGMAGLLRRAEAASPRPAPPSTAVNATAKPATPPSVEVSIFSREGGRQDSQAAAATAPASAPGVAPPDSYTSNVPGAGVSVRREGQLPAHPSVSTFRLGHFLRSWQGSVGVALLLLAFGVAVFALMRGGTAARNAPPPAPVPTPGAAQVVEPLPLPPATQPSPALPAPETQAIMPVTDPAYAVPSTAGQPFYITPVAPGPVQSDAPRELTVVSEGGAPSNEEAGRTKRRAEANANAAPPARDDARGTQAADEDARPPRPARTPEPERRPAPPAANPSTPAQQPTPGRPKVIQWPPQ